MRWRDRKGSENIEDRRGEPRMRRFPFPGGGGMGGRGVRIPIPAGKGGGISIVGLLFLLGLMFFLGIDPRALLQDGPIETGSRRPQLQPQRQGTPQETAQEAETRQFTSVVLKTTEEIWSEKFRQSGSTYKQPRLVLFRDATQSACGTGVSQMGPFYCPLDQKVYIDLSFFDDLQRRFDAPGDFAQAYVIAHEIGHHIQTLLGVTEQVVSARQRAGEREGNAIQVRMELQADCYAGIWAHQAQNSLQLVEAGDIDEALNAAAAIGDDKLQRRSQGYVVPDAFTHGTSDQRVRWFRRGFESGDMASCDTFSISQP